MEETLGEMQDRVRDEVRTALDRRAWWLKRHGLRLVGGEWCLSGKIINPATYWKPSCVALARMMEVGMGIPARDLWEDHELGLGADPVERIERPTAPVRTLNQSDAIVADRRKLAIGRAILEHGARTAGDIARLCAAEGLPVDCADRYARTLVRPGFLVTLYLRPVRWDLTDKGRVWVLARINGEGV